MDFLRTLVREVVLDVLAVEMMDALLGNIRALERAPAGLIQPAWPLPPDASWIFARSLYFIARLDLAQSASLRMIERGRRLMRLPRRRRHHTIVQITVLLPVSISLVGARVWALLRPLRKQSLGGRGLCQPESRSWGARER